MGIFSRKSVPRITREQALATRPVHNPDLEVIHPEGGEVTIRIPRRKVWWVNLLAKLGGVPQYRTITLDRVGTSVWELCDGRHTVRELITRLAEEHQLSRKEAELSMVTYLKQLAQRGLVLMVVDEDKEDETD